MYTILQTAYEFTKTRSTYIKQEKYGANNQIHVSTRRTHIFGTYNAPTHTLSLSHKHTRSSTAVILGGSNNSQQNENIVRENVVMKVKRRRQPNAKRNNIVARKKATVAILRPLFSLSLPTAG